MSSQPPELSTRQRILAYLAEHNNASAHGLSRVWGLTPADIRYHLKALFQEGCIERVPPTFGMPADGAIVHPGRPEQFYRLPMGAAPNNLVGLCAALLSTLPHEEDKTKAAHPLQAAAVSMIEAAPGIGTVTPTNAILRLNLAVETLDRWGYRARWEAGLAGPRVLLRNCPYAAVVINHPEICVFDRFLLEKLTGIPLKQTARINPVTGKPSACVFSAGAND